MLLLNNVDIYLLPLFLLIIIVGHHETKGKLACKINFVTVPNLMKLTFFINYFVMFILLLLLLSGQLQKSKLEKDTRPVLTINVGN